MQSNIGIGWRHPHYKELLERQAVQQSSMIDFLEIQSENFFGAGGAALAALVAHIEPIRVSDHALRELKSIKSTFTPLIYCRFRSATKF